MRLLLIADTYVPVRISGALQMRDLARELLAQGHEPTVVTPASDVGAAWQLERLDGVEVLRVRAPRTKDVWLVQRAIAECLLPFIMLRALRNSPVGVKNWGGVVWYSPTIFFGPLVKALKTWSKCPAYLIVRDLFPDWAVDAGVMRKGVPYRFFKWVERYQYGVADVIGVQTPANAPLVAADSRQGSARIEVLHNWLAAPVRKECDVDLSHGPLAGRTIFVYAGNMGTAQGMDALLDVAARMQTRDDVGFLFVGRGSDVPRLRALAKELGLRNVLFMDEVDSAQIPGLLAQCHVGLIALDPRHNTHNIPGKFLTYLRAGMPVLARINPGNDLQAIIDEENVGYAVAGDPIVALHAYAEQLASDPELRARMATNGLVLAERMFSPTSAARQVVAGLAKSDLRAPAA
ncbi:MAG: glycosyltransferase family 4 protein [Gemmatimonadaceae bacterium]|nr:glycosyltransferase family 4 protein [Gemmatimonadaceae bacterium]